MSERNSEQMAGSQCPEYDGDDEEHEVVDVTETFVISNDEPAIQLTARCTCGWQEQRIIRGE